MIKVSPEEIWTPDIVACNDVGRWDTRKYKDNVPAMARHVGRVSWQLPIIMETMCSMDVSLFSFDQQECTVYLGSWQYTHYPS